MLTPSKIEAAIRLKYRDRNFCVEMLAQELVISKSHLREFVCINYLMSPQKLIETIRLEHAIELLARDEKIYIVASKAGYCNIRSFRRAFLSRLGIIPSKYRLILQQNENKDDIMNISIKNLWNNKSIQDFVR